MNNQDVVIIGMGYIGLPTAALISSNNINVLGVDINKEVVDTINKGKIHIVEPELDSIVEKSVKNGNLKASTIPREASTFIIVVPTPFTTKNEPDISFVKSAFKSIIPFLNEGNLCIIESTCPVGTTEKMKSFINYERPDLTDKIYIAYCPERVLPGNVMFELVNNDRVIGGIDEISTEKAVSFYKNFVLGNIHSTNSRTAEMCKLVENSSRDVQIAFANELSLICDKANIDVWELISLANKHPRVNILNPGSGVGGHCIAVDPYFISSNYPLESKIIATAREVNNYKSFWCVEKIEKTIVEFELCNAKKPKVAIMGLAFKPDIDDLRESPALYISKRVCHNKTDINKIVVEPNINEHPLFNISSFEFAIKNADIIVFLVAHKEFRNFKSRDNSQIILDFCGVTNN